MSFENCGRHPIHGNTCLMKIFKVYEDQCQLNETGRDLVEITLEWASEVLFLTLSPL